MSESLPAPLKTVCRVAGVSRSAAYEQRRRRSASADGPARRRPGPVGAMPDAELLAEIRQDLRVVPVRRRGAPQGVGAAAAQARRPHEPQAGAQVDQGRWAARPDPAGTQALPAAARGDDHGLSARHAVGDRRDRGLDPRGGPLRGVRDRRPRVRRGLVRRRPADGPLRRRRPARARSASNASARSTGPSPLGWRSATTAARCFRSDHYQTEIDHLGIARSPAFHYEPETNGCAEKAIQTLKEQLLWIDRFDMLDELRTASAPSAGPTTSTG